MKRKAGMGWALSQGLNGPHAGPIAEMERQRSKTSGRIFDVENELLTAWGLELYDRPNSVFSYASADFGLLGIFVAPFLILVFVCLCAAVLSRVRDPFLRSTLMGFALYYALNIEGSSLGWIQLLRDFFILAFLYTCSRMLFSMIGGFLLLPIRHHVQRGSSRTRYTSSNPS